jgi:hypothetical protein
LIQQEINRQAAQWLDESKGRLRIEIVPVPGAAAPSDATTQSGGAPK